MADKNEALKDYMDSLKSFLDPEFLKKAAVTDPTVEEFEKDVEVNDYFKVAEDSPEEEKEDSKEDKKEDAKEESKEDKKEEKVEDKKEDSTNKTFPWFQPKAEKKASMENEVFLKKASVQCKEITGYSIADMIEEPAFIQGVSDGLFKRAHLWANVATAVINDIASKK